MAKRRDISRLDLDLEAFNERFVVMAEVIVGLVSDDSALFEFWYRNATSLGYAPSDFRFMLNILRTAQEAWAHHVYYAEINGLPVLDEFEYIRYFILNHCPKKPLAAEIIS